VAVSKTVEIELIWARI